MDNDQPDVADDRPELAAGGFVPRGRVVLLGESGCEPILTPEQWRWLRGD
jgi:hypothetical protein